MLKPAGLFNPSMLKIALELSAIKASLTDHADLGARQLYAYTMRHYLQMPMDLKVKELLAQRTTNADLRYYASSLTSLNT